MYIQNERLPTRVLPRVVKTTRNNRSLKQGSLDCLGPITRFTVGQEMASGPPLRKTVISSLFVISSLSDILGFLGEVPGPVLS